MSACAIFWDPWTAASQTSGPAIANTSSPTFATVADLLLDTGAWVALLDRREREHARCVEALQGLTGRLISTEAVLTETLWLVSGLRGGPRRCAEFVRRGAVALVPISPGSLGRWGSDGTVLERFDGLCRRNLGDSRE